MARGKSRTDDQPHPVDIKVGLRMRQRRMMLGMSQSHLGQSLGLTFQQIQKYERGANRVSASKLHEMSRCLGVPITYFFEASTGEAARRPGLAEAQAEYVVGDSPGAKRETLRLVRAFQRIHDPVLRRKLYEMAKALSKPKKPR